MPVHEIERQAFTRTDLANGEVNRVLGGGLVQGSIILLGGEPGIGKSTLSLQLALKAAGLKTLYVSGEESPHQIKMRAERIGIVTKRVTFTARRTSKTSSPRSRSTAPTWS